MIYTAERQQEVAPAALTNEANKPAEMVICASWPVTSPGSIAAPALSPGRRPLPHNAPPRATDVRHGIVPAAPLP
eukprot:CAMPEP_0198422808 /NCGR_PEP_ID=MMETSP1452-20131203/2637_1 /TAXON_ID=1181717 /ORGANISM="Synchroma pusillum, Strain CCMP3072" /LENGTH=74 /DNA_ID=CAMNT_0044143083 /DNA_START=318 /DNA_END=539 /DNA_ORIENTATION=+